jgi:hypothetical protein
MAGSDSVHRFHGDIWIAVTLFLEVSELAALSRASRDLRRTVLSNGVWEWLLRRDFDDGVLRSAADLQWMPAEGLPHATHEHQFVHCYLRLRRCAPPWRRDDGTVDTETLLAVDCVLSLPRVTWRAVWSQLWLLHCHRCRRADDDTEARVPREPGAFVDVWQRNIQRSIQLTLLPIDTSVRQFRNIQRPTPRSASMRLSRLCVTIRGCA